MAKSYSIANIPFAYDNHLKITHPCYFFGFKSIDCGFQGVTLLLKQIATLLNAAFIGFWEFFE